MSRYDVETLEFPLFCDTVRKRFLSSFASDKMSQIKPKASISEALVFQKDIQSIFMLVDSNTPPRLNNDSEFYILYKKIVNSDDIFLSLEPEEYIVLMVYIKSIDLLKRFLSSKKKEVARLSNLIDGMQPDVEFAKRIERTFEDNGDIKDSASPELKQLRGKINSARNTVMKVLNSMFSRSNADKYIQDPVVVLRNGRYTIPCKTNFSQYISGIIHDRSTSGQTLYIEPTSAVDANNSLRANIIAESEEVNRILSELLAILNDGLPTLHETVTNYSELAFRIDIANFYRGYDITFPEFLDNILFVKVHHPLLKLNKNDESVAIDVCLDEGERLVVISGPNTGGKTAALKSIGLNHLIGMCGLPIIGKRAQLKFFTDVKADIGDKQSLVMDLSTFSSHMTNIKDIIEDIGPDALVLFDELGTGTDPKEGAALALAVLEDLDNKGATVIITTHFSELKTYAFQRGDAKNYAVDFDYDTFAPRYNLLEGVAGSSDPIVIAKRLGFPKSIIDSANMKIEELKSGVEIALDEIHLLRAEAEHAKRTADNMLSKIQSREERLRQDRAELDEKLAKRELELLEDTYALLQKGKRLANERVKVSVDSISDDLESVGQKIKKIKSKQKPIEELAVGDVIYLDKYSKIAKILSLEGKSAYIDLEGIRVKINRNELVGKKMEDKKPEKVKVTSHHMRATKRELVLVGKRVEEALDMLDKFIDESHLASSDEIYVIHGRGTGQLRTAIHEYLRGTGRVAGYRIATNEEGGNAITVVTL